MDARRLIFLGFTFALFTTAACGPEPTPLPVVAPTPTPLPQDTNTAGAVVADSIVKYMVDPVTEEVIAAAFANFSEPPIVQVLPVPRLTGDLSEIVLSSQAFDGGQLLPAPFLFGVVLDSAGLSLESSAVTQILIEYLRLLVAQQQDSEQLADARRDVRETLANIGYPDGFRISLDYMIPSLVQDLSAVSVEAVQISTQPAQIQILFGDAQREAAISEFGEANVVYGFTLPLYYAASPGLQITMGNSGLPIIANDL